MTALLTDTETKLKDPKVNVNQRVFKILYLEHHFVAGVDLESGRVWAPGYLDPAGYHYCVARLADHPVAVVGHGRLGHLSKKMQLKKIGKKSFNFGFIK